MNKIEATKHQYELSLKMNAYIVLRNNIRGKTGDYDFEKYVTAVNNFNKTLTPFSSYSDSDIKVSLALISRHINQGFFADLKYILKQSLLNLIRQFKIIA